MICPECREQNIKSHVFILTTITENTGEIFQYFDEEGNWHNHIGMVNITTYRCHNYHYFQKIERPRCWCMSQEGVVEILPYEPTVEEREK